MKFKWPIPEVVGGIIVAAACLVLVLNDKYRWGLDRGVLDIAPGLAFVFYVAYKRLYADRNR